MIFHGLMAILCWLVLLPAIYLLGSFFQRWIREEDEALRGVFFVASGLGILSYFIALAGSWNVLTPWPLVALLGLLGLVRFRYLPVYGRWIFSVFRFLKWPEEKTFLKVTLGVFFASVAATVSLTFLPEIAHDSLCYHLNLPKLFVQNASILPLKYDLKSYQSQFMECLYTIGVFLRSVPVAKLFHLLTGFLLALSVMIVIDKKTGNRTLAVFMGTVLWLTPTLFNQVSMTYNDAGVALFVWLSFLLFSEGLVPFSVGSGASRFPSVFFLSGLFLGFATSCKYLALMFGVPMGLWLVYALLARPGQRKLAGQALMLFCGGVLLGCAYWFMRNYMASGNPLYPILAGKFGGPGLYTEQNYAAIGVSKDLLSFLKLPFSLVFLPDSFERHSWAGPVYLLLLPFSLWGAFRNTKARLAVWISLLSCVFWFLIAQNVRFLLPIFPLMIFAAACGIYDLRRVFSGARLNLVCKIIAISNLLLLLLAGGYHYRVHFQALFQGWTAEDFLTRLERTYPAAQWVNTNLPADARIFSASEVRLFYFDRPVVDEVSYYRVERYSDKLKKDEFRMRLRELGITHVMRVLPLHEGSTLGGMLEALATDTNMATFVQGISSRNIREPQYRYLIYKLLPGEQNEDRTN